MIKKLVILLTCFMVAHIEIYATEYDQVQLISTNNDYGLELDWMQIFNTRNVKITGEDAAFDKAGNMYLCGRFWSNFSLNEEYTLTVYGGQENLFIMKIDSDKNIKWLKVFSPAEEYNSLLCQTSGIKILDDDNLIFKASVSAMDLYYDSKLFYNYDGDCYEYPYNNSRPDHSVILKLSTQTGELKQSLATKPPFEIDKLAVGTDGNIYLCADMVKDFCGINKDLPSDCRSTGKYDKYIAKLTPDFKLIWNFTINETFPYDKYARADIDQMLLSGDSLFIVKTYCSNIQINPDKSNPVYVPYVGIEGEEQSYENILVTYYNVGGDKPVLENYQHFDANYVYKCPHIEGLSTDKYGNLYGNLWVRKDGHYGIKFNKDMTYDTIRTMPLGRPATYGINVTRTPWRFNENKNLELNFLVGDDDKFAYIDDTLSIPVVKRDMEGFAKYDSDKNLRYVLYLQEQNRTIMANFTDDNHGGLYFMQESSGKNGENYVNWSLTEKVDVFSEATAPYKVLIKYTETFRIREELSDRGTIKQAGEMVRYGSDVEIEVQPQKGYRADSVVTSTGFLLVKQSDGTFLLPHVTDRVILKAYYSPSTGIEDNQLVQPQVYPNPATDRIHVSTINDLLYDLTDVKGRKITEGMTTDGTVNIASLASGCYLLQINNDKIVKFEKK